LEEAGEAKAFVEFGSTKDEEDTRKSYISKPSVQNVPNNREEGSRKSYIGKPSVKDDLANPFGT
jgi:hypothetical protein